MDQVSCKGCSFFPSLTFSPCRPISWARIIHKAILTHDCAVNGERDWVQGVNGSPHSIPLGSTGLVVRLVTTTTTVCVATNGALLCSPRLVGYYTLSSLTSRFFGVPLMRWREGMVGRRNEWTPMDGDVWCEGLIYCVYLFRRPSIKWGNLDHCPCSI